MGLFDTVIQKAKTTAVNLGISAVKKTAEIAPKVEDTLQKTKKVAGALFNGFADAGQIIVNTGKGLSGGLPTNVPEVDYTTPKPSIKLPAQTETQKAFDTGKKIGVQQLISSAAGVASYVTKKTGMNLALSNAFTDISNKSEEKIKKLLNAGVTIQDERSWFEQAKDPKTGKNFLARELTSIAVSSAPSVLAGGVGAAAGLSNIAIRGIMFSTTAIAEGGAAYVKAKAAGADDNTAEKALAITGVINGLLETVPGMELIKKSGIGKRLSAEIAQESALQLIERLGKSSLDQALIEIPTEMLQEVVSNVATTLYDKNQDLFEGVAESGALAALFGGSSGAFATLGNIASTKGIQPGLSIVSVGGKSFKEQEKAGKVFNGVDGKPRFEVSDADAKFEIPDFIRNHTDINKIKDWKVGDVLKHEVLFNEYPWIENINLQNIEIDKTVKNPMGVFEVVKGKPTISVVARTEQEAKSTLLHEITHAIQKVEGLAMGGNPESILSSGLITDAEYKREWLKEAERLKKQGKLSDFEIIWKAQANTSLNLYKRIAGEVEARAVQRRMNFTQEDIDQIPFAKSFDIPVKKQIVSQVEPTKGFKNTIYHGSDSGELKIDNNGNINLSKFEEGTARFGKNIAINADDFTIETVNSLDELFDIVADKERKQKFINKGVDILTAGDFQIAINPKEFSKKTGIPLREKSIREKTIDEVEKENVENDLIEEAKKYTSFDEFVEAQFNKKPEYGMSHRAGDVIFAGDDINEFGYYPRSKFMEIWQKAQGGRSLSMTKLPPSLRADLEFRREQKRQDILQESEERELKIISARERDFSFPDVEQEIGYQNFKRSAKRRSWLLDSATDSERIKSKLPDVDIDSLFFEGAKDISNDDLLEMFKKRIRYEKLNSEVAKQKTPSEITAEKKKFVSKLVKKESVVEPPQKELIISQTEKQLLKARIKSESRGSKWGFKAGFSEARARTIEIINTKQAGISRIKKALEEYIILSLEQKDRGKFITSLRTVTTQKAAARAFARIDLFASKQQVTQAISRLKNTVEKLSESKSISVDYRNKIKAVVEEYELSGHSEQTLQSLQGLQDFVDKKKAGGMDVELPQRLVNKLKILSRIQKDQITLSQVQALEVEIELLARLGATKLKAKENVYAAEKQKRKDELLKTITPINLIEKGAEDILDPNRGWVERFIKVRNYLKTTNAALKPIDGFAEATGMTPMKSALDLSFGDYLSFNDKSLQEWYKLTKKFNEKNFRRVGLIALSKQEGGVERLANSGVTQEQIDSVELTEEELAAYNFVREKFDSLYPDVKKYSFDIYNEDVGKIDNYVSFMSDFEQMSDLELYQRFGQRAEEAVNLRTKTVEQGFRKSRAGMSDIKLELNIDKIFRRHMDDVAYLLTMGKDIKMYSEIVNTPEMREKLGDIGTLGWSQWLDLMARKGGVDSSKRVAALDFIRRNIGAGVLSFRLSTVLVQLSSFADTIGTIGAEYSTRGAYSISTSKEWRAFIMDNFPEVAKAVGDDVAFREFGDGYLEKATRLGLTPMRIVDGYMRSVAAAGAYQMYAEEYGIEIDLEKPNEMLVQLATKSMRNAQGSSFRKDTPLALSTGWGLTENLALNKTLLTFQSFALNRWDNMRRQIWTKGFKEGNYKKGATSVFWFLVFGSALEEGLRFAGRNIMHLLTDDDDEEEDFIKNSFFNIIQGVPIMGSIASALMYSSNPVPVLNIIDDIFSGIKTTLTAKSASTKQRGALQVFGAVGSLAGVPGSSQFAQILRDMLKQKTKKKKGGVRF